ncbi:TPA: hypothetical protein R1930_002507, partial [Staphylococcus delphini]|nr:hypothetical protein [Staphylococcus delphini]
KFPTEKLDYLLKNRFSVIEFEYGNPVSRNDLLDLLNFAEKNNNISFEMFVITNNMVENEYSNKMIKYNNGHLDILNECNSKDNLYLPKEYSKASVVILFTCDINHTIQKLNITYEQILQEIGTISQLLWLKAIDKNMFGSVFAGTLQKELKQLVDIDYITKHQIFALGLSTKRR